MAYNLREFGNTQIIRKYFNLHAEGFTHQLTRFRTSTRPVTRQGMASQKYFYDKSFEALSALLDQLKVEPSP
jgi:hypothetical protein